MTFAFHDQLIARTLKPGQSQAALVKLIDATLAEYRPDNVVDEMLVWQLIQAAWHQQHCDFDTKEYRYADKLFHRCLRTLRQRAKDRAAEQKAAAPTKVEQVPVPATPPAPTATAPRPRPCSA